MGAAAGMGHRAGAAAPARVKMGNPWAGMDIEVETFAVQATVQVQSPLLRALL